MLKKIKFYKWVFFYYLVSWYHFNLGIHIDFKSPNIEIHIPFGFIRFGKEIGYRYDIDKSILGKTIGFESKENIINIKNEG